MFKERNYGAVRNANRAINLNG